MLLPAGPGFVFDDPAGPIVVIDFPAGPTVDIVFPTGKSRMPVLELLDCDELLDD